MRLEVGVLLADDKNTHQSDSPALSLAVRSNDLKQVGSCSFANNYDRPPIRCLFLFSSSSAAKYFGSFRSLPGAVLSWLSSMYDGWPERLGRPFRTRQLKNVSKDIVREWLLN